jgi:hypothetical protein
MVRHRQLTPFTDPGYPAGRQSSGVLPMKLRFHGNPEVHDARLVVGGAELQALGYRAAIVVRKPDGSRVFTPPEAADDYCVIVWATPDEWQLLAEHGYARKTTEELPPTDGEIPF